MALTTLDAVRAELPSDATVDDALLEQFIDQASSAIEGHCRRSFGRREVAQVLRLVRPRDRLMLEAVPLAGIVSVVECGVALAAGAYEIEDAGAGFLLRLDAAGSPSCWPTGRIEVTAQVGWLLPGEDGRDLPPAVERACLDLVLRACHSTGRDPALRSESVEGVGSTSWTAAGSVETEGGLPADIAGRLAPYRLMVLA